MILPVVCALLASSACSPGPAAPKVASISLADLVRHAEVIFVGRVEEVCQLDQPPREGGGGSVPPPIGEMTRVPVAKVRVERGLKGVIEDEVVHYLAAGTWTCDTTRAVLGERALFFLNRSDWPTKLRRGARLELRRFTDSAPASYQVAHSGRGRMPLRVVEGDEFATFWSEVRLPEALPTIPGPEEESSLVRSVHLRSMEEQLAKYLADQLPFFSLSHRQPLSPVRGWRFRVWGDGVGVLFIEDPERPRRVESKISPERIAELATVLKRARESALSGSTLGLAGPDGPSRLFEGRSEEGTLRFELHTLAPELAMGEEERRAAAGALELWAELRGLFDEPRTLDARERDRACLEAWGALRRGK